MKKDPTTISISLLGKALYTQWVLPTQGYFEWEFNRTGLYIPSGYYPLKVILNGTLIEPDFNGTFDKICYI